MTYPTIHLNGTARSSLLEQQQVLADALRAMDYLSARPDVDSRHGFAMTGVSGGGHTTMWSCLIDDRIRAVAPVCSATRLEEHGVLNAYASCPEIFPIGRLERGMDDVDLMIAACDLPQLYMAGKTDEVFSLGMSEKISAEVAAAYQRMIDASAMWFYTKNTVGRYVWSRTPLVAPEYFDAMVTGIVLQCDGNLLDIFDDGAMAAQVPRFLERFSPGEAWVCTAHAKAEPFTHYYQAVYRK